MYEPEYIFNYVIVVIIPNLWNKLSLYFLSPVFHSLRIVLMSLAQKFYPSNKHRKTSQHCDINHDDPLK